MPLRGGGRIDVFRARSSTQTRRLLEDHGRARGWACHKVAVDGRFCLQVGRRGRSRATMFNKEWSGGEPVAQAGPRTDINSPSLQGQR